MIIVFAALIVIGSVGGDSGSSDPSDSTESTKPQAIKISAEDLYEAYEQNEIAAEKKYDDQLVEVTGVVGNIGTDILNDVYVTLTTGDYLQSVQCYFEGDEEVDKVTAIVEGQEVTIVGTCSGLSLTNVLVKDCSIVNASSAENDNSQTTTEPETELIEIAAADLFAAYNENEVAADSKYEGKKLKITGTINNIGTDILDNVYITLDTGEVLYSVQCYFKDGDEEAKVADLKKGDTVTLIGVCEGMSLNVIMKRCEIQ